MSPHRSIHSNQRKRKEEGHQKKGAVTKVCVCLKTSSAPPLSPPCWEHLYGSCSILGLHSSLCPNQILPLCNIPFSLPDGICVFENKSKQCPPSNRILPFCNVLFSSPDANEKTPMLHALDSKVLMGNVYVTLYSCVHNHTCHPVLMGDRSAGGWRGGHSGHAHFSSVATYDMHALMKPLPVSQCMLSQGILNFSSKVHSLSYRASRFVGGTLPTPRPYGH